MSHGHHNKPPISPNQEEGGGGELPNEDLGSLKEDELHEEDMKLRKLKRKGFPIVVSIAIFLSLLIATVGLSGTIKNDSAWAFSASVAGFVVIYGIIIKSFSPSPQQDNNDSVVKFLGKNIMRFIQKYPRD